MWTWFRMLFRTAAKLTEIEREFADIREAWEITITAFRRREERDRKRATRDLHARLAPEDRGDASEADTDDVSAAAAAYRRRREAGGEDGAASGAAKADLWHRATRATGTEGLRARIAKRSGESRGERADTGNG